MINRIKPAFRRWWKDRPVRFRRLTLADCGSPVDRLADAMRRTECFCMMHPRRLQSLIETMRVRRGRAGEILLREGIRDDRLILLASGQAQVTRRRGDTGGETVLASLTRPTVLGEDALLGLPLRKVTVTLLTDGLILELKRSAFSRFVATHEVQWEDDRGDDPAFCRIWLDAEASPIAAGHGGDGPRRTSLAGLRGLLSELDPARHYLCAGRSEADCALAAFVLTQRGFQASARRGSHRLPMRD